jgi:indole-3-glycerol phosphate synthase
VATSATSSRLDEIVAYSRAVVGVRKAQTDLNYLERAAAAHTPRGFVRALREKTSGPAIIAEIKQASPSKGTIRENVGVDVAEIACALADAGAAALSVLTEEKWFLGSLKNLQAASRATADTMTPCLRKDFILDEFQLLEARANNADAVLLIAAALDDPTMQRLASAARQRDLDVLIEVHTAAEMDRVLALEFDFAHTAFGVNSRDLHTFAVSLEQTAELADKFWAHPSIARLPAAQRPMLVAESGIASAADIATLRQRGYGAYLIGELLMRATSPGRALQELLAACG